MAGYVLGNRDNEEQDIDILSEGFENSLNFSKSVRICLFDYFSSPDKFLVPYSTIRKVKSARLKGAREVIYMASSRPDRFPHIKSLLELWGFNSYIEYLYTVAELGFLEGLIPVLDVGFITPDEMKFISEISALLKLPLESMQDYKMVGYKFEKASKQALYRKKNLEWAGKLKIPTITGLLIGSGITKSKRKAQIDFIAKVHDQYGTIHEVALETYNLKKPIKGMKGSIPSKADVIDIIKQLKSVLPDDVLITVNLEDNSKYIANYIKAGVNDLGTIGVDYEKKNNEGLTFQELDERIAKVGKILHQRFPLSKRFVKEEKYSKKLGQVFDAYRYKIKKEQQERAKEAKV